MRILAVLAWRNVWRHRYRTAIAVLATALGLAFAVPSNGLMVGLNEQMLSSVISMHLGAVEVHAPGYLDSRDISKSIGAGVVPKIRSIHGVTGVAPRIYSGGIASSERRVKALMKATTRKLPPCGALVGRALASRLDLSRGDAFSFDPLGEGGCDEAKVVDVVDGTEVVWMTPRDVRILLQTDRKTAEPVDTSLDWDDDSDIDLPKLGDATSSGDATPAAATSGPSTGPTQGFKTVVVRSSAPVGVLGVDPVQERKVTVLWKRMVKGSYLPAHPRTPSIILGVNLASRLGVKPGDRVGLDVMTPDGYLADSYFTVVGLFRSGSESMDRSMAFVDMGTLASLMDMKDQVHEIAIALRDPHQAHAVASSLSSILGPSYEVKAWDEIEPSLGRIIEFQQVFMLIMLGIIFAIAAVGVMNVVLVSVMERTREFGVLRALGTSPWLLVGMVILETIITLSIASVVGGAAGWAMNHYLVLHGLDLSAFMPTGFTFESAYIEPVLRARGGLWVVLEPAVLLLVVGTIFSVFPASRAARVRPVEVLRD